MRLSELEIENFRGFGEGAFAFKLPFPAGITVLVGGQRLASPSRALISHHGGNVMCRPMAPCRPSSLARDPLLAGGCLNRLRPVGALEGVVAPEQLSTWPGDRALALA